MVKEALKNKPFKWGRYFTLSFKGRLSYEMQRLSDVDCSTHIALESILDLKKRLTQARGTRNQSKRFQRNLEPSIPHVSPIRLSFYAQ